MAITLTESAATQIKNQLARRGKGLGLRVGVKKVGCSGFAYTFDYADEMREGDRSFESHDATVVVAAESRMCMAFVKFFGTSASFASLPSMAFSASWSPVRPMAAASNS